MGNLIKQILREETKGDLNKSIKGKLRVLRNYIKILNAKYNESDIIMRYFIILHNFLIIEGLYKDEVDLNGKNIDKYLNLPETRDIGEIEGVFEKYYDIYSNVRSSVETIDNIDIVGNFLKKNPNVYNKLIKKLPLTESKKNLFIPRNIGERKLELEKQIKNISRGFLFNNNIKSIEHNIKPNHLDCDISFSDFEESFMFNSNIILINGVELQLSRGWYEIDHSNFVDYANMMVGYLNYLINEHNPKGLIVEKLIVKINSNRDNVNIDISFNLYRLSDSDFVYSLDKEISFTKTI